MPDGKAKEVQKHIRVQKDVSPEPASHVEIPAKKIESYDPENDPHLAAFRQRQKAFADELHERHKRMEAEEKRKKEKAISDRKRIQERQRQELDELASKAVGLREKMREELEKEKQVGHSSSDAKTVSSPRSTKKQSQGNGDEEAHVRPLEPHLPTSSPKSSKEPSSPRARPVTKKVNEPLATTKVSSQAPECLTKEEARSAPHVPVSVSPRSTAPTAVAAAKKKVKSQLSEKNSANTNQADIQFLEMPTAALLIDVAPVSAAEQLDSDATKTILSSHQHQPAGQNNLVRRRHLNEEHVESSGALANELDAIGVSYTSRLRAEPLQHQNHPPKSSAAQSVMVEHVNVMPIATPHATPLQPDVIPQRKVSLTKKNVVAAEYHSINPPPTKPELHPVSTLSVMPVEAISVDQVPATVVAQPKLNHVTQNQRLAANVNLVAILEEKKRMEDDNRRKARALFAARKR